LRQRQHDGDVQHADRHVGGAPAATRNRGLHEGRPDGAGDEQLAVSHDGDRDAAPLEEPLRGIGDERPEGGGQTQKAISTALTTTNCQLFDMAARKKPAPSATPAIEHRHHDAEAVHLAHDEATAASRGRSATRN
jgi:hypothetical protein